MAGKGAYKYWGTLGTVGAMETEKALKKRGARLDKSNWKDLEALGYGR